MNPTTRIIPPQAQRIHFEYLRDQPRPLTPALALRRRRDVRLTVARG
jgi:hypothetical protein